mmetsp:Transcript_36063/g.96672  ORF Transcript_36063/g.96672 Transcript_36063/m.96672 type:complete len:206 (-) Transcript_36063:195-812(-)
MPSNSADGPVSLAMSVRIFWPASRRKTSGGLLCAPADAGSSGRSGPPVSSMVTSSAASVSFLSIALDCSLLRIVRNAAREDVLFIVDSSPMGNVPPRVESFAVPARGSSILTFEAFVSVAARVSPPAAETSWPSRLIRAAPRTFEDCPPPARPRASTSPSVRCRRRLRTTGSDCAPPPLAWSAALAALGVESPRPMPATTLEALA